MMMTMDDIMARRVIEVEGAYGKLIEPSKAAEYLGLDTEAAEGLVRSGQLGSVSVGGRRLVKPVQLVRFELDISDAAAAPTGDREAGIMKVTKGSIYSVSSKANPLELRFAITFDDGERRTVKVRGRSEAELLRKKDAKVAEALAEHRGRARGMSQPDGAARGDMRFRDVAEEWLEGFRRDSESKGSSYSSVSCRTNSLKAINGVIGDMRIGDIDREAAQGMIDRISKVADGRFRSQSHIKKAMGTFRLVMEHALERGYTDRQVGRLSLNKNLTVPDKDARFIDTGRLRRLLACVGGHPFYNALVHLMLASGMRQEEALALNIDDVRKAVMDDGRVMCQVYVSKAVVELSQSRYGVVDRLKHGERARHIDITGEVHDMLVDYYKESMKDEPLVRARGEHGTERMIFVNKDGKVHNKRTLHHSFKGYLERNGWDDGRVTLHMLRHTYASLMKDEIPLDRVSEILGHKDIAITKKFYDTQTLEDHRRAGEAAEAMMRKIKG